MAFRYDDQVNGFPLHLKNDWSTDCSQSDSRDMPVKEHKSMGRREGNLINGSKLTFLPKMKIGFIGLSALKMVQGTMSFVSNPQQVFSHEMYMNHFGDYQI